VRDAMQLDYEVILLRDCTSSFDGLLFEAMPGNVTLFFGDVPYLSALLPPPRVLLITSFIPSISI